MKQNSCKYYEKVQSSISFTVKVAQSCPTLPGWNTGVGSHSRLQRIFPNSGIKPSSPALQMDSLPAEPRGKPKNTGVGSPSLLQRIFPTQESGVSCIAGRFFTNCAIRETLVTIFLVTNK